MERDGPSRRASEDRRLPTLPAAGALSRGRGGAPAASVPGQAYWARPVPSLGVASARLLLVGLAPAAHGGNRTGRMFTGRRARAGAASGSPGLSTPTASRPSRPRASAVTGSGSSRPTSPRPFTASRPTIDPRGPSSAGAPAISARSCRGSRASGSWSAWAGSASTPTSPRPGPSACPCRGPGRDSPTARRSTCPGASPLLASYHPSRQNTQTGRLTWTMFEAIFAEARRRLGPPPARWVPPQ